MRTRLSLAGVDVGLEQWKITLVGEEGSVGEEKA